MRLRKRHAWSAALIALFALPIARPEGFPAIEDRVDSFLGWTGRFEIGNPHAWTANDSDKGDGGSRMRALEQIAISEREAHFELLDQLAQRGALAGAIPGFDGLPLATSARILRARDASPLRRSLLVDRGADDGVAVGQAVTQGRVLVGVVSHVDAHTARVQMLTDRDARIEVAVRTAEGVRAVAWLRGGTDDELALRNLRGAEGLHVRPGDAVLTSNGDERVPAGLVVGYVVRASDDDADAILDVRVRPSVDLDRSTTVLILRPGK